MLTPINILVKYGSLVNTVIGHLFVLELSKVDYELCPFNSYRLNSHND